MNPAVRHSHPGYFLVAVQIILTHLGLAVDAIVNHHGQPQWQYVNQILGSPGWIAIHLSVVALGVGGVWGGTVLFMRSAWLLSFVAFLFLGLELGLGAYSAGTAYVAPIVLLGTAATSWAMVREDPREPGAVAEAHRVRH